MYTFEETTKKWTGLQWFLAIILFPIWGPIAFLIGLILWVGIPILVQLIVIFLGVGALWLLVFIANLFS